MNILDTLRMIRITNTSLIHNFHCSSTSEFRIIKKIMVKSGIKEASLSNVNYQTPKAPVQKAHDHSFEPSRQLYPLHAFLLLQLFWRRHQHPVTSSIMVHA